ncbi:MAG: 3-ketoacyl-ACP reductase [Clostridia bacterium]
MIAIVTGGTRGIGLAIVQHLVESGYTCVVGARKTSEALQEYAQANKSKVDFCACDIASESDRKNLLDFVVNKYSSVDLLVNNAGVAPKVRKDMLDITEDDFDFLLDINLKGTYFLTQIVAKQMIEQKSGRIINISSMSSYTASVNRAEYCIAKAGISMITKLFATKLADFGVGVFEIMPGIIETDMISSVKGKYDQLIADGLTPIKRLGKPSDIAKCVIAIANGNLDFCTGTVINADGGFHMRRL